MNFLLLDSFVELSYIYISIYILIYIYLFPLTFFPSFSSSYFSSPHSFVSISVRCIYLSILYVCLTLSWSLWPRSLSFDSSSLPQSASRYFCSWVQSIDWTKQSSRLVSRTKEKNTPRHIYILASLLRFTWLVSFTVLFSFFVCPWKMYELQYNSPHIFSCHGEDERCYCNSHFLFSFFHCVSMCCSDCRRLKVKKKYQKKTAQIELRVNRWAWLPHLLYLLYLPPPLSLSLHLVFRFFLFVIPVTSLCPFSFLFSSKYTLTHIYTWNKCVIHLNFPKDSKSKWVTCHVDHSVSLYSFNDGKSVLWASLFSFLSYLVLQVVLFKKEHSRKNEK